MKQGRTYVPLLAVLARSVPSRSSNDWLTRDGRRHSIEWSNFAVPDERGGVGYVIAIGLDLERQSRVEAAAAGERASEAHLADILTIAADAIISIDR